MYICKQKYWYVHLLSTVSRVKQITVSTSLWNSNFIKKKYFDFLKSHSSFVAYTNFLLVLASKFLMKKQDCVTDHHSYNPALSSSTYFLIPKLKNAMKGAFCDEIPAIQAVET